MPRRTHLRAAPMRARPRRFADSVDGGLFCSRCGKMSGGSEAEAWQVAMHIYHTRGGDMPQRVYSCAGDGTAPFHWTRRA